MIYKEICKEINLIIQIITSMIKHNNLQVISHIVNDFTLCRLFKKSIDPICSNFTNQSDIMKMCLKNNNHEITNKFDL